MKNNHLSLHHPKITNLNKLYKMNHNKNNTTRINLNKK